jgi:hypothetical protein
MKIPVQRLTEYIRAKIQYDITNNYTALSPKKGNDGTYTMLVKDGTDSGLLEVVVREKKVEGER